jgi:hypothetical protein
LKKANELLKKYLGADLPLLGNRKKRRLVDALKLTPFHGHLIVLKK